MVNRKEIEESIEQNKSSIINWEVLDRLDLDFTQVEIEALLVDKYQDDKGSKWGYSLITTIYSKPNSEGLKEVYSVRWSFREDAAHLPYVSYDSYERITGAILLESEDIEGFTSRYFYIIAPKMEDNKAKDELDGGYDYYTIFSINDPYEISVRSVEWKGYQIIR